MGSISRNDMDINISLAFDSARLSACCEAVHAAENRDMRAQRAKSDTSQANGLNPAKPITRQQ